jgi:hypothetical protein
MVFGDVNPAKPHALCGHRMIALAVLFPPLKMASDQTRRSGRRSAVSPPACCEIQNE